MNPRAFRVCGVRLDALELSEAADEIITRASSDVPTVVHLCNAYVLALASRDGEYSKVLNRGDLNLPDGKSVAWFGRHLGFDYLRRSVPGPDLFESVLSRGRDAGIRHYLYGSHPEVVERLVDRIEERFSGARIVGAESPPFRPLTEDEEERTAERIRESGADIVWVGLGTPKQDWVVDRLSDRLDQVFVPVGAAFDFLAGTRARAPLWLRDLGLEWTYRLATEPRRLLSRYVFGNAKFLACALGSAEVVNRSVADGPGTTVGSRGSGSTFLPPQLWRRKLRRTLVAADAAIIGLSSLISYQARVTLEEIAPVGPFQDEIPTALGVLPLWLTILALFGCYHPAYLGAGGEAARRFLGGTTVGVLVLGFLSFALRLDLSRFYVALMFLLVLTMGVAARAVVRSYVARRRKRGELTLGALIVGYDEDAREIARSMNEDRSAGYEVRGFVTDDLPAGTVTDMGVPVVGGTGDVLELAFGHGAGLVVIAPTGVQPGIAQDIAVALEGSPVDVAVAPSLFQVVTRRVAIESVANVPLLHVEQIRLSWGRAAIKRLLDLVVATTLFVLLAPVMIASAIAIRLSDGGSVLFRQERVGRDERRFTLLKFRTMVPDAEDRLVEVEDLNEAGHHFFKVREDPRVTDVGRFLRKWSIDETPQLWNVIKGQMSMVGPRPPLPREVAEYEDWHLRRLRVKPGITGIWQVSGRSHVPFEEAVRLDLFYIENWSLGLDLVLLAKTVPAVLGRRGAY